MYDNYAMYQVPDSSKCDVIIPTVIVNKKAKLLITLRDIDNDFVINKGEKITVNVEFDKTEESVPVKAIKEVSEGRYKTSFTVKRCGYYTISIIADEHHIPGSPYR